MADNNTAEGKNSTSTGKTGTDSLRDRRDAAFERARSAVEGLENPTAEHIAAWIFERVKADVPRLCLVRVFETPMSWAETDGR